MGVLFENNAYFRAVSSGEYSSFPGTIQGELISKHNRPTLSTFKKFYTPDGWIGRKIIAIPASIGGLIQAIYHIVLSIFAKSQIEKDAYRALAGLDWDTSAGWISSLFSDDIGLFYIQKAQFYKTCLAIFFKNGLKKLDFQKLIT